MSNQLDSSLANIVDAHVHVWTDDMERYPLAPGFTPNDFTPFPLRFTAEELAEHGHNEGVTRFNLVQMTWYGLDHSYIADVIAADPMHFVGTGILPALSDVSFPPPDRTMRTLAEQGIYAFRMRGMDLEPLTGKPGQWMDHPSYEAIFMEATRSNLALSFLIGVPDLPEISRMCELYPDTPVILDHIGRIGSDGDIDDADVQTLCNMAKHPGVMVKIGAFYALGAGQMPYTDLLPIISRVVDAFGPDRCMWESDSPLQAKPPHSYAASVELIRDHADFLSDGDKQQILIGTAEAFFFNR